MESAMIFSIQKFCTHDGPGIRTTIFFKGCPLTCTWCHNPESQTPWREILWKEKECIFCGACVKACKSGALSLRKRTFSYNEALCTSCESCLDACAYEAREFAGKLYTVDQVMAEIEQDRPFYEESGGGVTLSGGEALIHFPFVKELLHACKQSGISVAIDTCGQVPQHYFAGIIEFVDIFLYDLKVMDSELHKQYTGKGNELICSNLQALSNWGARIYLRLPLIQGVNDDLEQIEKIRDFIAPLTIEKIHLLPYHDIGKVKYEKLSKTYEGSGFMAPSAARMAEIIALFEQSNQKVQIGG